MVTGFSEASSLLTRAAVFASCMEHGMTPGEWAMREPAGTPELVVPDDVAACRLELERAEARGERPARAERAAEEVHARWHGRYIAWSAMRAGTGGSR